MKIVLPISRKTFAQFKTLAVITAPNDYYNKPHARSSSTIRLQELDANKRQNFLDLYAFAQDDNNFPFNICYEVADNTWGEKAHLVAPKDRNLFIYSSWGYFIDHTRQLYAYRSCGGNMHGVFKNLDTNEYFAFYDGARSVFALPHSIEERKNNPVLLETNAPPDMHWWENQADYLIRKGETHCVKYFAKQNNESHTRCDDDAYYYFAQRNPNFEQLIYKEMFKTTSPEMYLLNKYHSKKIKPEKFTGKDLIAWNLLNKETQERILRWA